MRIQGSASSSSSSGAARVRSTCQRGDNAPALGQEAVGYLLSGDGSSRLSLPAEGIFLIGRDEEAQVPISGDFVSRQHCQGEMRQGKLHLRDCSRNGTFIDGERLPSGDWVEVPEGAQIGFAQTAHTLRVELSQQVERGVQMLEWPDGERILRVGCSQESDLCLAEQGVRPHHALLQRRPDGGIWVLDNSEGGTFVNGQPVSRRVWTEVPPGQPLGFGDSQQDWRIL